MMIYFSKIIKSRFPWNAISVNLYGVNGFNYIKNIFTMMRLQYKIAYDHQNNKSFFFFFRVHCEKVLLQLE